MTKYAIGYVLGVLTVVAINHRATLLPWFKAQFDKLHKKTPTP